jgi:hypothetical protein
MPQTMTAKVGTSLFTFMRVERNCEYNKRLRLQGITKGILYDWTVNVDGRPFGEFRRDSPMGRPYTLCFIDSKFPMRQAVTDCPIKAWHGKPDFAWVIGNMVMLRLDGDPHNNAPENLRIETLK